MKVNKNEVIVAVDVDNTLIRRPVSEDLSHPHWASDVIAITNPYDKQTYKYLKHPEHIELLRQYKGRGFYVIVWSANGVGHAESVVRALGLDDGTVDEVMTKCMKHVDDRYDIDAIVGARVFIPREGFTP